MGLAGLEGLNNLTFDGGTQTKGKASNYDREIDGALLVMREGVFGV